MGDQGTTLTVLLGDGAKDVGDLATGSVLHTRWLARKYEDDGPRLVSVPPHQKLSHPRPASLLAAAVPV